MIKRHYCDYSDCQQFSKHYKFIEARGWGAGGWGNQKIYTEEIMEV